MSAAADILKLERALADGKLTVEIAGQRITYRSIDEIMRAIAYLRSQVAAQMPDGPLRQTRVIVGRGRGQCWEH